MRVALIALLALAGGARRRRRGTVERPALGDRERPLPRARGRARRARCGGRRLRPPHRRRRSRRAAAGHGRPPAHARDRRPRRAPWPRLADADLQRPRRAARLAALPRRERPGARARLRVARGRSDHPAGDHGTAERLQPRLRRSRPTDLLAPAGRLHGRDRQPERRREDAPAGGRRVRVRGRRAAGSHARRGRGQAAASSSRPPARPARALSAPAVRLSAPGGFARSPQLAFTPDGHTVALWTQSDGLGRALVSSARPPGGAFGAPTVVRPSSDQVLTVRALGSSAGDVLVAFVSARSDAPAGPLRALRLGPNGQASSPVRTLTPSGERTRDVSLAADNGAGYAAWTTGGVMSRHAVRVVRIAGSIVGTVRTAVGLRRRGRRPAGLRDDAARARADRLRDDQRPHPAGHATGRMTRRDWQVRRRAGGLCRELAADLRQRALLGLVEDRERALTRAVCSGKSRSTSSWPTAVSATVAARRSCARRLRTTSPRCSSVVTTSVAFALDV